MLREVAEYPNSFGPLGPQEERIETERFTLCLGSGKSWNTVQRHRFDAADVDDVLDEVRSLLRARGRGKTQWEIGSSAQPPDLVERLLARGLVRDRDPFAVALVLEQAPSHPEPGLAARVVRTFEEYQAANEVQWEAFEMPASDVDEARSLLPQRWNDRVNVTHAVWLDGAIVCAGTCSPTSHGLLLYGGATVPRARGRGAYRALLQARWEEAVSRDTPALITQGGAMSRPSNASDSSASGTSTSCSMSSSSGSETRARPGSPRPRIPLGVLPREPERLAEELAAIGDERVARHVGSLVR